MLTSTLRTVGGSVMMAIPKPVLEGLGLAANEKVGLRIDEGRLVVEPRPRRKYTLDELVAQCDMKAAPCEVSPEWDAAPPVGREVI
jgi:antitoxin ChpS